MLIQFIESGHSMKIHHSNTNSFGVTCNPCEEKSSGTFYQLIEYYKIIWEELWEHVGGIEDLLRSLLNENDNKCVNSLINVQFTQSRHCCECIIFDITNEYQQSKES